MVLNMHGAIPTPMPYYFVNRHDPIGDWKRNGDMLRPYRDLRSIRAAQRHLNLHTRYLNVPPMEERILHVKRDGSVEVVE